MQNRPAPRIRPLLPPEWNAAALDGLGAFPKSLEFVLFKWNAGGDDARGMNALGLMAHYPALAKAFMTLNAHVASTSTLPVRTRELAILRTSWLRHFEYEFVQHIILGKRAGITDAELEQIQAGPEDAAWSAEDADLLLAVDELIVLGRIADATWARITLRYSPAEIMDLIFLVGCYEVLGMAISCFDVELEPGLDGLAPDVLQRLMHSRSSVAG